MFIDKFENITNKEISYLTRKYLELCFFHFLEQVITRQTGITDHTATLIYHIFSNSPDKFSQSSVIDLGLYDDDLIYFIKKTS